MTTTRIATLAAALIIASAAALVPATAAPRPTAWTGLQPYGVGAAGPLGGIESGPFGLNRNPGTCPTSSAAEGNANQQNFPVQQYGQTAGGNRC